MSRTMNHSLSDRAAPTSQEFITQIYKKYDRLMLFTAKKYLMDLQECEDAVQESLLKLMSRIELCCNYCTQYGHQYTAAAEERCPEYNIIYRISRREYHRA